MFRLITHFFDATQLQEKCKLQRYKKSNYTNNVDLINHRITDGINSVFVNSENVKY